MDFFIENIREPELKLNASSAQENAVAVEVKHQPTVDKMPNIAMFRRKELQLKKYTIPQLKIIARHYALHVSGTKPILENRILDFFARMCAATTIQRMFRGWVVRASARVHGPALMCRELCVNDTDFFTLENMDEIPRDSFFSFEDTKKIVYGFNIESIAALISKSGAGGGVVAVGAPTNPYTREVLPTDVIERVFQYIRIYRILRPDMNLCDPNIHHLIYCTATSAPAAADRRTAAAIRQLQNQNTLRRLEEIRQRTLDHRIANLFIDIDMLGNYTSPTWFSHLSAQQYVIYWNCLYDIWLYRAGILDETKKQICPVHGPFSQRMLMREREQLSREAIQDYCLYAMENMVYMSGDEEFRKLGAMYVLSALTVVSPEARRAMPWLFEMIAY